MGRQRIAKQLVSRYKINNPFILNEPAGNREDFFAVFCVMFSVLCCVV